MHQKPREGEVNSVLAVGLMSLALLSFAGCSTKSMLEAEKSSQALPTATWVDRGNGIYFIPTAEGVEASRALGSILKEHPGSRIAHIERTGRFDAYSIEGCGFIVVLEE